MNSEDIKDLQSRFLSLARSGHVRALDLEAARLTESEREQLLQWAVLLHTESNDADTCRQCISILQALVTEGQRRPAAIGRYDGAARSVLAEERLFGSRTSWLSKRTLPPPSKSAPKRRKKSLAPSLSSVADTTVDDDDAAWLSTIPVVAPPTLVARSPTPPASVSWISRRRPTTLPPTDPVSVTARQAEEAPAQFRTLDSRATSPPLRASPPPPSDMEQRS